MEDEEKNAWLLVKGVRGSKNRYGLNDKVLELEDVLPEELVYPQTYGIFLKTHCDDGSPLEGFVLLEESPPAGSILEVRPLGALKIKRPEFYDEIIVSVASEGRIFQNTDTLEELAESSSGEKIIEEIVDFFDKLGKFGGEEINVEEWLSKERTGKILEISRKLYKRKNK